PIVLSREGTMTALVHLRADRPAGEQNAQGTPAAIRAVRAHGLCVEVEGVSRSVQRRRRATLTLLESVSFAIAPGGLVGPVGPSGAGKPTLLEAIAGVAAPTAGMVRFDGVDLHANLRAFRGLIGYVPQDDTIHTELPLEHSLRYAARLRLPTSPAAADIDAAVRAAIATAGLTEHADVRVGSLSGGQRKRASIAVELLTDPRVFFLDEPTSGLDPSTSAELIAHLRTLADRSATVVFTTHSVEDLAQCDRIVFMARGGRVGFVGTVEEAFRHFGVGSVSALYRRLTHSDISPYAGAASNGSMPDGGPPAVERRPVASPFTQWRVLTCRTAETFVRNPLTLAILLASPVLVVGMFALLFRAGAFDFNDPSPSSMV